MKIIKILAIFFFDLLDIFIHQKKILKIIKKQKKNIGTLIDVGSHKGIYTDLFLKNFKIKRAYLFEPQVKIFNFTKEKYKKNNRITVLNKAISNSNNFKSFFVNKHDLTSSLTRLNEKNNYLKKKSILFGGSIKKMIKKIHKVKTIRLSNFIRLKKIKSIDLLKVDTEGHEYEVLLGLGKNIKIVKMILIEFHNDQIYTKYDNRKIHRLLIKNNFILIKKIKFPFTEWDDRIYVNKQC